MNGCKNGRSRGFTIIETLVYLAVAGLLFLVTIFYLGGKQRSTQFRQGVREFESTLNDVANDTSTGVFPSFTDIVCSVQAGTSIAFRELTVTEKDPNDPVRPGENNECIFVGNVVQLTNEEADKSAASYFVHTLVGQNNVSIGSNSFQTTIPKPLYERNVVDATDEKIIPWGVVITKAYAQSSTDSTSRTAINGIGYLYSSFGDSLATGSNIKTGVASVSLYVREDSSKLSLDGFRSSINYESNPAAELLTQLGERVIHICIDGLDGRQAMIEIGGQSGSFIARTNFNPSQECLS